MLGYSVLIILFHITDFSSGGCPDKCIPIRSPPLTCIFNEAENGTNLSWFDAEKKCAEKQGRLVWLRDDFDKSNMISTGLHARKKTTTFIIIGLLMSMKTDKRLFWRNPADSSSYVCGTNDTDVCLSTPSTNESCNAVGCCWVNGKCQYPESQWLTGYNISAKENVTATGSTTEIMCVGLQKDSNGTWTFTAYNCSLTRSTETSFICEYKCGSSWPSEKTTNITQVQQPTIRPTAGNMVDITTGQSATQSESTTPAATGSSTTIEQGQSITPAATGSSITIAQGQSITPAATGNSTTTAQGQSTTPAASGRTIDKTQDQSPTTDLTGNTASIKRGQSTTPDATGSTTTIIQDQSPTPALTENTATTKEGTLGTTNGTKSPVNERSNKKKNGSRSTYSSEMILSTFPAMLIVFTRWII